MNTLTLTVVTPTGVIYHNTVNQVSVTTMVGELTILPNHIPLVTAIARGELRFITEAGATEVMAIEPGALQVSDNNEITVMVNSGVRPQDIDPAELEIAIERARTAMEDKSNTLDIDFARFQSQMERDLNSLRIAKKWRK